MKKLLWIHQCCLNWLKKKKNNISGACQGSSLTSIKPCCTQMQHFYYLRNLSLNMENVYWLHFKCILMFSQQFHECLNILKSVSAQIYTQTILLACHEWSPLRFKYTDSYNHAHLAGTHLFKGFIHRKCLVTTDEPLHNFSPRVVTYWK